MNYQDKKTAANEKPRSLHRMARASILGVLALVTMLGLAAACIQFSDGGFMAPGVVVDHRGKPVPGVTVKGRHQSAITDEHGCFTIDETTYPGKQQVPFSVTARGFKPFVGTIASPGVLIVRVRVALVAATSDTQTVVDFSPAPGTLGSCEPSWPAR